MCKPGVKPADNRLYVIVEIIVILVSDLERNLPKSVLINIGAKVIKILRSLYSDGSSADKNCPEIFSDTLAFIIKVEDFKRQGINFTNIGILFLVCGNWWSRII